MVAETELTEKFKALFEYVVVEHLMWREKVNLESVLHIIFAADRESYLQRGRSLTDTTWHKGSQSFPSAPVPSGWEDSWEDLITELELEAVECPPSP